MGMQRFYSHKGFTLIELVVVMLVIAVIAGATITAFNSGFVDDQEQTAALYEMTQIRDAILQFKQDNPSHSLTDTNLCSPADASFLLTDAYDTDNVCNTTEATISAWDPNYRLGWQGPYMQKLGNTTATSVVNIEFDGTVNSETALANVTVLSDPYGDTGNPYYFFDLDDNDLGRIVSFGPNGIYESAANSCSDTDSSGGDDLVVCLR